MPQIRLMRTNDIPLVFEGERFAKGRSATVFRIRRYRLALYRTDGRRWVLATEYRSLWPGEPSYCCATEATELEELRGYVDGLELVPAALYLPLGWVHDERFQDPKDRREGLWIRALADLLSGSENLAERIE